jgi:hypothetical protein
MEKGISFRLECRECERTFLSPDRKKKICPRCLEKVQKREEWAKKQKEAEEKKIQEQKKQAVAELSGPQLQPLTPLTGEIMERVFNEYESLPEREVLPWRKIHRLVAKEMKIPRRLVAEALDRRRRRMDLSAETEKEIIRRYREYVVRLERPAEGRRKRIAADLGISYQAVVVTVREWKRDQPSVKELSRKQRFQIEKSYFEALAARRPLADVSTERGEEIGCSPFQFSRYLDLLHDGIERFKKVPEATGEEREVVLAAYAEYLAGNSPPEPFLHNLITAKTGVTPRTVHKTLLQYRLERLQAATR